MRTLFAFAFTVASLSSACTAASSEEPIAPPPTGDSGVLVVDAPLDGAPIFDAESPTDAPNAEAPSATIHVTAAGTMAPAAVHVRAVFGREDFPDAMKPCNAIVIGPTEPAQSPLRQKLYDCLVGVDAQVAAANATMLKKGSPITARFEWDFGDGKGKWNALEGFNAAHVYDAPGTYVVTLTVTNEAGISGKTTKSITVLPDARAPLYVDAIAGSDANDGSSPTRALKSMIGVQSAQNAMTKSGATKSGVKILFKRGQTFDVTQPLYADVFGTRIEAYGDGTEMPVLMAHGTSSFLTAMHADTGGDILVDGIAFDSDPSTASAGWAGGFDTWVTNFTLRGCEMRHVLYGVQPQWSSKGLLVQDSRSPNDDGLTRYFVWIEGTDVTILGNFVANSIVEHDLRSSSPLTDRVLIAHNELNRIGTPGGKAGTTINLRRSRYAWIGQNVIHQGTVSNAGDWGWNSPAPYGDSGYQLSQWMVVERNEIHSAVGFGHAGEHLVLRNNVLSDDEGFEPYVWIEGSYSPLDAMVHPYLDDVWVVNNTIDLSRATATITAQGIVFGKVSEPHPLKEGAVHVHNNFMIAPAAKFPGNWSAGVFAWNITDEKGIGSVGGDVWPVGAGFYFHGGLDLTGFMTLDAWNAATSGSDLAETITLDDRHAPPPTSKAAKSGEPIAGVLVDYAGAPRPKSGPWSAGAVQVAAP